MTFTGGKALFVAAISTWVAISTPLNAGQAGQPQFPPSNNKDFPILASNPGEVTLRWTAPGNDGIIGVADHYVIKYSAERLTELNWNSATSVSGPPAPLPAGSSQSCQITDLDRGGQYYFAIKTFDESGNVSILSNVVRKFAGGIASPTPLAAVIDSSRASVTLYADTIAAAMAVFYQFAVDLASSFPDPIIAADSLDDSIASASFSNLVRGGFYYWRCRAVALDYSDSSLWSTVNSFLVPAAAVDTPEVYVNTPNGGESWNVGSVQNITWADSDDNEISAYKIEYSTNGGGAWLLISDWTGGDPHNSSWTLPNQVTNQARIRVSCRNARGGVGTDCSNADFALVDFPPVTDLTSPDGGESWNCGAVHDITWSADDNMGIVAYKLEYSINAGSNWQLIQDWTNGNPDNYPWVIPDVISRFCRVKITVRDINGLIGFDASDSNFAIIDTVAPEVTLTNPNGGEKFRGGMNRNITWNDGDNIGISSFKLDCSVDGGANWYIICDWTDGDPGRYSWDVPNMPSNYCRVCVFVRDDFGNESFDISDRDFQIREGRGSRMTSQLLDTSMVLIYDENLEVWLENQLPSLPSAFFLGQSYPNPFNAVTSIDYGLPEGAYVSFDIYDITGRHVATLINGYQEAGYRSLIWDSGSEPSGIYLYRLKAGDFVETKKMTVIK